MKSVSPFKTLWSQFELYSPGAAKDWITVIICIFHPLMKQKKKRNVTEWVQNRIHWRFCLIDPFINPKKYCNWLEPPFPDGMAAVRRALTSKLCFSVRTPASGSQKFLHTNLVILWHVARCSLTADLMWRPQPNLPLSPFTLKHCWISASAHLVRILFW